jgi:serine phosphatase RsbU (regulator of sigma subunit)
MQTQQKEILFHELENWKGNHEQVDDITILGIEIN